MLITRHCHQFFYYIMRATTKPDYGHIYLISCFMVSHLDNSNLSKLQNQYFVKSKLSPYIFPLHTVKHSTVNITVYCNFYSLLHYLLLLYLGMIFLLRNQRLYCTTQEQIGLHTYDNDIFLL